MSMMVSLPSSDNGDPQLCIFRQEQRLQEMRRAVFDFSLLKHSPQISLQRFMAFFNVWGGEGPSGSLQRRSTGAAVGEGASARPWTSTISGRDVGTEGCSRALAGQSGLATPAGLVLGLEKMPTQYKVDPVRIRELADQW